MPRVTTPPIVKLALSPVQVATALSISPARVAEAVAAGRLIVRMSGNKRRIAIFGEGGVQHWIENYWPRAKQRRKSP